MKCTAKALQRANDLNDRIKAVIADDREKRFDSMSLNVIVRFFRAQRGGGQVDGFTSLLSSFTS